ncbi:MAG: Crp/Fnr family transcriptional regulator [Pyrinomonadaceae bacterium]
MPETAKPNNQILAALPKKEYQRLLPDLEEFDLIYTKHIYEDGERISHVYFPESGIVSLLSSVGEKALLEVGIVGSEGMIGLPVFAGYKASNNRAVVQGEGSAMKMSAANFLKECKLGGALSSLLQRYTYFLLMQISQSAACNLYHRIEPRLARWLMMTRDRMHADEFKITQEFLSHMLGVRREAVSKAAANLQQQHLISYSRGNLSILNRAGLEKAACQCYQILKAEAGNYKG